MKTNPLVTIYIPCRNYGKYLRQSIESVLSQIYSNWELFIIDEGSNDDGSTGNQKPETTNPVVDATEKKEKVADAFDDLFNS